MPHIHLQLHTDLNASSCPSICCVVDTAVALCIGNYHFFATIVKRYPQCAAKIFLPEDYSPIILSGIVQNDADAITTDLAIAFQFHLPYLTKDGSTTSFVVATGPQVSVKMVLGLPLIIATGMIIDFVDKVVEEKRLDCPPFKIDFCCTIKTIPAADDKAPTTHYIKIQECAADSTENRCLHCRSVQTTSVGPSFKVQIIVHEPPLPCQQLGHCDHFHIVDQLHFQAALGPPTIGGQYNE
jgi:hypothetical protein